VVQSHPSDCAVFEAGAGEQAGTTGKCQIDGSLFQDSDRFIDGFAFEHQGACDIFLLHPPGCPVDRHRVGGENGAHNQQGGGGEKKNPQS